MVRAAARLLVALDGRAAWLAVAAAAYPGYLAPALGLPFTATSRAAYLAAVVTIAVAAAAARRRLSTTTGTRGGPTSAALTR